MGSDIKNSGDFVHVGGSGDRVYDYIRLVVAESKYLDSESEWRIIDNAVFQLGMMPSDVRSYLLGAATLSRFSTESMIVRILGDIARGMHAKSSKISRKQFKYLVETAIALSQGELSADEAEAIAKTVCNSTKLRHRRRWYSGSRRWYIRIPSTKDQVE